MTLSSSDVSRIDSSSRAYQQLNKNEIRLIRLKPLAYNRSHDICEDVIVCDLKQIDRSKEPEYIAISYAWGRNDVDQEISVGGHPQFISFNLADAIKHLRHGTDDVVLWADQLSINQKDDTEKNRQVQMMKSIYQNASHAIVWLGGSADDSDLIMTALQELSRHSDVTPEHSHSILSGIVERISNLSEAPWNEQKVLSCLPRAFESFCNRAYWKRLWVIQEFAVCRDFTLTCGSIGISCETFLDIWSKVHHIGSRERFTVGPLERIFSSTANSFVSGVYSGRYHRLGSRTLYEIMVTHLLLDIDYNYPQCKDPRDRVFSLLGLACDTKDFDQFPDYTKPTEQIYEELARVLLWKGFINILACCQFPRNYSSMASWAPDWSIKLRVPIGGNTTWERFPAASGNSEQSQILFPNPKTVILQGAFVDTVKSSGAEWDPNWLELLHPNEALPYLSDMQSFCDVSARIPTNQKNIACARIAVADPGGEPGHFWDNLLVHYRAALDCFAHGEDLPTYVDGDSQREFTPGTFMASMYAARLRRLHSRRPFISDTGYVGLAPSHVLSGDRICIFLGASSPYILRPGPDDTFTLVGDCFVYGIMRGEFLESDTPIQPIALV